MVNKMNAMNTMNAMNKMNKMSAKELIGNLLNNEGYGEVDLYNVNIADYEVLAEVYTELNKYKKKPFVWMLLHNVFDEDDLGYKEWDKIHEGYKRLWDIYIGIELGDETENNNCYVSDEVLAEILAVFKTIKQ